MILSYIFQNSGRPSEGLEKCPSRPLKKKHSQKVLLLVCKIYRNEVWQNWTHLNCITKICWKMIGHPVRALSTSCEQQTRRILQDPSHLLHSVFEWFPSGRGLCRMQETEKESHFSPHSSPASQLWPFSAPVLHLNQDFRQHIYFHSIKKLWLCYFG